MTKSSSNSVCGDGIHHGRGFAGNQPVRPCDSKVDAASERSYVRITESARAKHWLEARKLHQLLAENIIDTESSSALSFHRFTRCDVSDADCVRADEYFPNPVHVLRWFGVHVKGCPFDGLRNLEIRPRRHFCRTILYCGQIEFSSQYGG